MNAIEQAKQEIQSALESIHKVESDLGWSDDSQAALASLVRATAALSSVDAQPVAWTNQQLCDLLPEGVMWGDNLTPELVREILLAASRVPQAAQPVSPAPSDKEAWEIYSRAQQSAGEKKGFALAIAITQAIIAEVRALAAHPVAPGVPEGFRLEKLYEPERIKVEKIGGGFCCFCKTGSGGVETAAFEFLNAMLSASPSLATERDAVDAQKVRNDALEEAANLLESGSFLHDDAPDARLAQSAAKAIRSLQSQPASAGKDAEDARRLDFIEEQGNAFTWGIREHTEPVGSYVVNLGDSISVDGPTFRAAIDAAIAAIEKEKP